MANSFTTDEQLLVSTHKCHESTAQTQFLRTRENEGTNGTVLARHSLDFLLYISLFIRYFLDILIKLFNGFNAMFSDINNRLSLYEGYV